jgi:hypothetical protein
LLQVGAVSEVLLLDHLPPKLTLDCNQGATTRTQRFGDVDLGSDLPSLLPFASRGPAIPEGNCMVLLSRRNCPAAARQQDPQLYLRQQGDELIVQCRRIHAGIRTASFGLDPVSASSTGT